MEPAANLLVSIVPGWVTWKRQLTQSKTLPDTDEDTTSDEASDISPRRECLHERCDHNTASTSHHTGTSTKVISDRATEEKASHDSTDSVSRVHCADNLIVWIVEVGHPVLGALDGVVDRGIVAVEDHA